VAVVLLVPSRASLGLRVLGLGAAGLAIGLLALTAPPAVIGGVGGAIGVVSGLPQLVQSFRRTGAESAVAPLTWAIRVASQAAWLGYGLMLHDLVVVFSATFLLTNALLVLLLETTRRSVSVVEPVALTPEPIAA
jgi:uncharacterized protein with PQ loop repeat